MRRRLTTRRLMTRRLMTRRLMTRRAMTRRATKINSPVIKARRRQQRMMQAQKLRS